MKTSNSILMLSVLSLPLLAQAAADFTTLVRLTPKALDENNPALVVEFSLPDNVVRTNATPDSAYLLLDVGGSELDYNQVYVNPPTRNCGPFDPDPNSSASIAFLHSYFNIGLSTEWVPQHVTFASNRLKAGSNVLLICVRDAFGRIGAGAGDIDNVSIRHVVLHYRTQ